VSEPEPYSLINIHISIALNAYFYDLAEFSLNYYYLLVKTSAISSSKPVFKRGEIAMKIAVFKAYFQIVPLISSFPF